MAVTRQSASMSHGHAAEDNVEILEGNVLAHSRNRDEIMELPGRGLARDVAVEWCGEPDDSRVVRKSARAEDVVE
jgi:hypothetical protein